VIDDHGTFIAGSSTEIPNVGDAATTDARAPRDGLLLAGQIVFAKIEVNGDWMEVTEVMKEAGNSIGPAAAIYEECAFLS
jgi:hypothetical protein